MNHCSTPSDTFYSFQILLCNNKKGLKYPYY
nr:MAG TPA: hypothetical protein [Caudoviricetes sp.]